MAARAASGRATAAGVEVTQFTPTATTFAGQPAVIVRGLVTNGSGVAATHIDVGLRVRRSAGGEPLLPPAYGKSWLDTLSPGQTGPFSIVLRTCCPEEIGDYEFDVSWQGASRESYRALAAEGQVQRTVDDVEFLYGELANTGDGYVDASSTRVYIGFWRGADFVDGRSAIVPVVPEDGEGGMGLAPGERLPWSTSLPELTYDRVELWPMAEPYPPDRYPVPLGTGRATVTAAERGVEVKALLTQCGTRPVENIVFLLEARDADGRLTQFDKAILTTSRPMRPGEEGEVTITWPTARPEVREGTLRLRAFAIEEQPDRPPARPCGGPRAVLYLPAAAANR
jgi:hypothetical protein